MGVKIFDLVPTTTLNIKELANKIIVLDGNLQLYQFLSSIRQPDGTPLTDNNGNITSHLSGTFYRTTRLMQQKIRPSFVFDGKPPELKNQERQRRAKIKKEATQKYEEAKDRKDEADMKKYASRTSRLTSEMIDEATELINALGLPVTKSPSEGEAQASHIVKQGKAYAVGSQDADCLMFGAPRLVKNLTLSTQRKRPGLFSHAPISPELVTLSDTLNSLGITQDQLIVLGTLIGTDYNMGGIKGIGPKNAVKLVKQHGEDFDTLFKEAKWGDYFDYPWQEVFNTIKEIPVTDDYNLEFNPVDEDKVIEILCSNHGFSEERISLTLSKLQKKNKQQKGLGDWM